MSVIEAIILALVQGITEFLPVSSLGHLALVENLMGMERGPEMLYETMLHLGSLAAVLLVFRKDIKQIIFEFLGICLDVVGNLYLFIQNRRGKENYHYARIISNTYRKMVVLILVSMIPTGMLGYASRNIVSMTMNSPLIAGAGILITGIVLIVIDFSKAGGYKGIREASYEHAMWMGICQGISVFPGFSRRGLSISAALLCGLNRKFAVKFSYLMSIPAIIGAFFAQIKNFAAADMTVGLGFTYVLGMIVASIVGVFAIRIMLKLVNGLKFRYFSYYCFVIGLVTLFSYYMG